MKRIKLNYDKAHEFVDSRDNARWDGWTIVLFTKDNKAYYSKRGKFFNGVWGYEMRIPVNGRGFWPVNVAN